MGPVSAGGAATVRMPAGPVTAEGGAAAGAPGASAGLLVIAPRAEGCGAPAAVPLPAAGAREVPGGWLLTPASCRGSASPGTVGLGTMLLAASRPACACSTAGPGSDAPCIAAPLAVLRECVGSLRAAPGGRGAGACRYCRAVVANTSSPPSGDCLTCKWAAVAGTTSYAQARPAPHLAGAERSSTFQTCSKITCVQQGHAGAHLANAERWRWFHGRVRVAHRKCLRSGVNTLKVLVGVYRLCVPGDRMPSEPAGICPAVAAL